MGRKTVKVTEQDHAKIKRLARERDVPMAVIVNEYVNGERLASPEQDRDLLLRQSEYLSLHDDVPSDVRCDWLTGEMGTNEAIRELQERDVLG